MHPKRRPGGMNGGQHRHHNNRGRRFSHRGPDSGMGGGNDAASVSRTRRMALQNKEKYQMMARDALSMGDRVLAESHLQHADHYHRILLSLPPEEHQQQRFNAPGEGTPQQGTEQRPQGNESGEAAPASAPAQGLPSFITQPGSAEFPEE